jgi:hypothetical protein
MDQETSISRDISKIVLSLSDLKIRRVTKSFLFKSCTYYVYETQLVIENIGNEPCMIVPGEFYSKHVLVDFSVFDNSSKRCTFLPSGLNDLIILKYVFLKLWERRRNVNERKLLYIIFVSPNLGPLDVKQKIEIMLSKDFQGEFTKVFFKAMWSAEKKICDILDDFILNYVPQKYKHRFKKYGNLKISNLFDEELLHFVKRLDDYFLLLIQLNDSVKPKSYTEIFLRDNKFVNEDVSEHFRKKFMGPAKYEFEFELKPTLPYQDKTTFHMKVIPPEGVKLDLKSKAFFYLFRRDCLLFWKNQPFDSKKIAILHCDDEHLPFKERLCCSLLNKLKIQQRKLPITEIINKKKRVVSRPFDSDVRAQLQEDILYLYFGGREKDSFCERKHKLLFALNLKDKAINLYHKFITILWIVFVFMTSWLIWMTVLGALRQTPMQDTFYLVINQYFWPLITTMLAQSIAAIVDYSRRSVSERFFLRRTFYLITAFTVSEIILLIVLPLFFSKIIG